MAIPRIGRGASNSKQRSQTIPIFLPVAILIVLGFLFFVLCFSFSSSSNSNTDKEKKFLYWGNRIDCPGKHCDSCAGLAHQESSLRCALEEALFLNRIFVMPSRMCLSKIHNTKGILHHSDKNITTDDRWEENSCAMDSLYDLDLISQTVPVVLDNSETWFRVLSDIKNLGKRGVVNVNGVTRSELKGNSFYSEILLINRTASPLAWFAECKYRKRSSVMLPYSLLPEMATKRLRDAANTIKELLGDYDGIHVRRGDRLKTRKDAFGVEKSLFPHLDRDTRPQFIQKRIAKWVPPGRTLFVASNERIPNFFAPLSSRYKLAYSLNFSNILGPLIENNYQLFMVERLILHGAKTFIKTFHEDEGDLFLTDDPKKTNSKDWKIPVYTDEEETN